MTMTSKPASMKTTAGPKVTTAGPKMTTAPHTGTHATAQSGSQGTKAVTGNGGKKLHVLQYMCWLPETTVESTAKCEQLESFLGYHQKYINTVCAAPFGAKSMHY